MAIDMLALERATDRSSKGRVIVERSWLREVHRELLDGQRAKAELASLRRSEDILDALFAPGPSRVS